AELCIPCTNAKIIHAELSSIKEIMRSLYSGSCFKAIKAKYINTKIKTYITRLLPNSACLIRNIENKNHTKIIPGATKKRALDFEN
ncbi:hypothetical protein NAI58_09515, partial [Francisella tularensis subsp. holarctica]|nr:hypothetical protein [Francisella tularensis subsp. holarctica]